MLRVATSAVHDWRMPRDTLPRRMASSSGVAAIDLSPDGTLVASVHGDGTLKVRRRADGSTLSEQRWQSGVLKDVAFSPNGQHLAVSAAEQAGVMLFDANTWDRTALGGRNHYPRLAWLDDGQLLAAAYERTLERWTPQHGFQAMDAVTRSKPEDLELSTDGDAIVLLSTDGMIHRVARDGSVQRLSDHANADAIASGSSLVVVAERDALVVTTPFGGVLREPLLHGRPIDVAVAPDDEFIAVGHLDGYATLWTTRPLERVAELEGHRQRVSALAFDREGEFLVTGSWDGDLRFWSLDAVRQDPGPRPERGHPHLGRTEVLAARLGTTSTRSE